jgi:hypothetical protein
MTPADWPARMEYHAMEHERDGRRAFAEDCRTVAALLEGAVRLLREAGDSCARCGDSSWPHDEFLADEINKFLGRGEPDGN